MKNFKRIASLVLALTMILCMGAFSVFADEPAALPTTGSITINYAGIGETYSIYKVLDAEVGANGAIVYKGTIPEDLKDNYFTANASGEISVVEGVTDANLFAALKTWAANQTATDSKEATDSTVVFSDVEFGYYVVVSTMDGGAVISVTSTNPDAVTNEKNVTVPQPTKEVADEDYSIGDTITYTVTFNGANYMQGVEVDEETEESTNVTKIVTSYTVSDTLPAFLTGAKVTSITIGEGDDAVELENIDFVNKTFNIPWADYDEETDEWNSLYPNGTLVTIEYTATLTSVVRIGKDNTNTVTITPNVATGDNDEEEPWDESWDAEAVVKTYATAIKKVDGVGNPLAGAKFAITGLTVDKTADGVYTVVSYDPKSTVLGTEMEVDANGMLYIVGLDDDLTLSLTETVAPVGYNKLTEAEEITSQLVSKEIYKLDGYRKYDAKGNIIEETVTENTDYDHVVKNLSDLDTTALPIENNAGSILPSTGGIGTTIFYIAGGVLLVGAAVLLITKRRMNING